MKWKDLSLKERKQIYDSVRVNNPGATYFDIKRQFDSIPEYEDGKDNSVAAVYSLPEVNVYPQNRFGDIARSQGYETAKNWKKVKEGTEIDGASVHSFAPTQTKKKTKKKTEEDYDSEFSEVLRKDRNSKKYQQEISRTIEQAIFPDERTRELVENVDKTYGTNYKRAYSNIAYKDMTKRGSYVKWGDTDKDGYGQINIKNIKDNVLPTDINDYNIILDNNIYMPGTANHELGHVADGLAGSRKIQDFDSGKEYITNTYLNYLANSNNTYSSAELRKMGLFDAAGSRSYLLNPTEAKSHMLTLKRSLKDSGKITNWSTPVDENMILEYMRNPTSNKMVKNQYDLYRNKNEYIDRLNKLIPMEILMPLGGAGFVGHELNKE